MDLKKTLLPAVLDANFEVLILSKQWLYKATKLLDHSI
jgi:hypothetical protein